MSDLKAKDIMKKPHLVHPEASVKEVIRHFSENDETLIVVDGDNNFLGEIHKMDLLKLAVPEKYLDEEAVVGVMGEVDEEFTAKTAKELMNKHEFTVDPTVDAEEIAYIMYKEEVAAVPVVKFGNVVGVVHVDEIIKRLIKFE